METELSTIVNISFKGTYPVLKLFAVIAYVGLDDLHGFFISFVVVSPHRREDNDESSVDIYDGIDNNPTAFGMFIVKNLCCFVYCHYQEDFFCYGRSLCMWTVN